MGFKLPINFELSIQKTVNWTLKNKKLLRFIF